MRQLPLVLALLTALVSLGAPISRAQQAGSENHVFLPLAAGRPPALGGVGVDLRVEAGDAALPYLADLGPRWVRAGDLLWSEVEPVRGGGYRWEAAAGLEANIRRIRAAGAEPIVVIQWSPPWAQRVPGRLCSPPAPAALADLARFAGAAAARYAAGPAAVQYWQLWNEADFSPQQVSDAGSGCWATGAAPYYGGDYYGQALAQVSPAIKAASPGARVLAGGLAHFWPHETQTIGFLRGMLAAGGDAFDVLSFSAYGTYQAADRVIYKANSLRRELASFGMADRPLFAAEVGAVCFANNTCQPEYRQHQADYASRIAAVVLALRLEGAVWHTLVSPEPGFQHSHLVAAGDEPAPWPAYYALRNAVRLLRGASPAGPPPRELDESQAETVQELVFATERGALHVLWLPRTGAARQHALRVPPGAAAVCTTRLDQPAPSEADCSDGDGDGRIVLVVGSGATYVEVRR